MINDYLVIDLYKQHKTKAKLSKINVFKTTITQLYIKSRYVRVKQSECEKL